MIILINIFSLNFVKNCVKHFVMIFNPIIFCILHEIFANLLGHNSSRVKMKVSPTKKKKSKYINIKTYGLILLVKSPSSDTWLSKCDVYFSDI